MSLPAADRLVADRYALKAPLGRGGMGVVWRAHDAVLGREVAVKEVVFPPTMAEHERRPAQARVMREARAAARLNHPGAVTLYDVVQDHGGTFIVMELVNAPTLAELVRADGPLPPERVAEIGAQVASTLEAAHAAGIVHRDVKPGNVMVPEQGVAKLADFGIASLQGDPQLTSTGLVIGSPAYMAPEQARGEASGPPADFWGLGATLFYAVEGEPPFDRGSSIATLAAVVNEPPRAPRRAGALTPIITALLAKDPTARPSDAEVRAELGRLAGPRPFPTEVLPVQGPGRTVPLPAAATPPVPGDATPVDEEVEISLREEAVHKALARLPETEREVVKLRFGINGTTADNVFLLTGKNDGLFNEAVPYAEIHPDVAERLRYPERSLIVSCPVTMDDGRRVVFLSQRDVRELQFAKASIATGWPLIVRSAFELRRPRVPETTAVPLATVVGPRTIAGLMTSAGADGATAARIAAASKNAPNRPNLLARLPCGETARFIFPPGWVGESYWGGRCRATRQIASCRRFRLDFPRSGEVISTRVNLAALASGRRRCTARKGSRPSYCPG